MNILARITGLALYCIILPAPGALAQGALTPPGPPQPTMKTLDELDAKLEKRTPISSLPFTINESGSYYLTRSLEFTAPTGHAVTIAAGDVTVDLNGFTLSSVAGVTGNGIHVTSGRNIAIKNGAIAGTTTVVITGPEAVSPTWTITPGGFSKGIVANAANVQLEHLRISGCRQDGVDGSNAVVDHVSATQNGIGGISSGLGTVTNSIAATNGSIGISASTVANSYANRNRGAGIAGSAVTNCSATYNGNRGISADNITNCFALRNGDTGFMSNVGSVINSTARLNHGDGIYGVNVIGCLAAENRTHGIIVRGTARDNESNSNGNLADGAGIYFTANGVRIEGNNCYSNDWGIKSTAGTNSFIVRNSCRGNSAAPANAGASGNYDFDRASNTYGPVETVNGDISTDDNPARASNPWANIQY